MPIEDLGATAWPDVNRLLDQALALPPTERWAWLEALPPEHDPLRETLRRLLSVQAGIETGSFLDTLPKPGVAGSAQGVAALAAMAGGGAVPADLIPQAGATLGPWRLVRELGEGGMGSVWLAERADGQLKRPVALKLPRLAWARGLAERMARERDILATLEHPNIARLYDAGVDQLGRPWLALEYVRGRPIDVYAKDNALTVRQRVELLLQVCEAVAYAHSRLVIHRDLKPGNILVTDDGQVGLLDFGIAKLAQQEGSEAAMLTAIAGRALTPDYASPEQVRGEALTTVSDVYSLGVVAYELLAGARPYRLQRGSAAELEEAIQTAELPAASATAAEAMAKKALRGDLDAILRRALSKSAADRYPTVAALADDLRRHLAGEPIAARPDGLARRLQRFARRHRWPLAAAGVSLTAFGLAIGVGATALVVMALLLGLGLAIWQAREARRQAREARREAARAAAVQGFLLDVFRANSDQQADPQQARATTARELLDRGSERVEAALADWPEARAQVLEVLGEMYYQLGEDERAAELDRRRVALLRRQLPERDPRLAEALVALAASLHGTRWRDEILPALQEAEHILDARGDRDSELRGRLLVRLAQRHQNLSTPKMLAYATEAVAVLEKQAAVNFGELSTALHLLARAHVLQGEPRRADGLYERALQVQQRIEPPSQVATAQTRIARGEGLIAQGCYRDAAEWLQAGRTQTEVALGTQHVSVLILGSRLAAALHASGRREEARALHATTVQRALELRGEDDTLTVPLTRMDWARSLLAEGAFEESLALVEQVNAVNRRHYDGSVVLGGGLFTQGQLNCLLGNFDRAAALFDEGESHWRRGTAGGSAPWRFNRMLFDRARLALARRDAETALSLLDQVELPPSGTVTLPTDEVERALIGVRVHALTGAASAALPLLNDAVDRIAASGMVLQRPAWQAELELARAEASLAAGDVAAAEAAARSAAAWRQANDHPVSPWTAEAETTWAEAMQRMGRLDEARAVAAQARERLARHARLGPQFVVAAQRLQAALDGRAA